MRSRSVVFAILLFVLAPLEAYADSATQADWSGGDGVPGPVTDWGDCYNVSSQIDSTGGMLQLMTTILTPPVQHLVANYFSSATSVYAADVDGDGDMDVLGAGNDDIAWWENTDGAGTVWTEHTVDGDFYEAYSVYAADVDGDGDMDVLGAAYDVWSKTANDDVAWWENLNGSGTVWTEHTIDNPNGGAVSVYAADIDGDGDIDVLAAAYNINDIIWWENTDGAGTAWTEHILDGDFGGAWSVYAADVDDDGDMDVLGAAGVNDVITWWENTDGAGTVWTQHIVCVGFDGATSVYTADVDGDGDMDVLGTAYKADDITWWENIDGSGTAWTEHLVDGNFDGAESVCAADIDGDGDMDIQGAARYADDITWWENTDGAGTAWAEHIIDGNFDTALSVYAADVDGDGDVDVLGAAWQLDDITWWDVIGYDHGSLESSWLYLGNDPDWGAIDWNCEEPPGTAVGFQVRATDDMGSPGSWSDTLFTPGSLEGLLSDYDSYLQYRAVLETGDPYATPSLDDVTISWNPLSIEDEQHTSEYMLLGTQPNPSFRAASIGFAVPEMALVELLVFDLTGHLVSTTDQEEYSQGVHQVQLEELTPGIYFCRMVSGGFTATQRFVVIE